MKIHTGVGAMAALTATTIAGADFVGFVAMERPMSTADDVIIGVYAVYDSPTDRLLGVNGPISFSSTLPLYNDAGGLDVNIGIDYDSWVAAGAQVGQTAVTQGWPGGPGAGSDFVGGTDWMVPDGEAWLVTVGPGTLASQNDDGLANHLLIANFAFDPTGPGTHSFTLEGEIVNNFGQGADFGPDFSFTHTFEVIPAPGVLAALAVAGLLGGGRRRR